MFVAAASELVQDSVDFDVALANRVGKLLFAVVELRKGCHEKGHNKMALGENVIVK